MNKLATHDLNDLFLPERTVASGSHGILGRSPTLLMAFDEVGRGCLAGPVVVGATLFELVPSSALEGAASNSETSFLVDLADVTRLINDSKKLSTKKHRAITESISALIGRDLGRPANFARLIDEGGLVSRSSGVRLVAPPTLLAYPEASDWSQPLVGKSSAGAGSGFSRTAPSPVRTSLDALAADSAQSTPIPVDFQISSASAAEIDALGIFGAIKLAAARAAAALWTRAADRAPGTAPPGLAAQTLVLFDGDDPPGFESGLMPLGVALVVKGDLRLKSIGMASILAKAARDHHMEALGAIHPGYGLERHKGYGTPAHFAAIESLGAVAGLHRRTFRLTKQKNTTSDSL